MAPQDYKKDFYLMHHIGKGFTNDQLKTQSPDFNQATKLQLPQSNPRSMNLIASAMEVMFSPASVYWCWHEDNDKFVILLMTYPFNAL